MMKELRSTQEKLAGGERTLRHPPRGAQAVRVCPGCGLSFTPTPPTRRFCRPTCQARHQRRGQGSLPFDAVGMSWESEW